MSTLMYGASLHPGLSRRRNEDTLFALSGTRLSPHTGRLQPIGLFVVADGMGGHRDGGEASSLAIQTVSTMVTARLCQLAESESQVLLAESISAANRAIYERNQQFGEKTDPMMMGTTITSALVIGATAFIASVGDSRTYLYRPREGLKQITRDHSWVARMIEAGSISQEEIYTHPKRNLIYRCLGDEPNVEVDSFTVPLCPRDQLVLCSDGLWELLPGTLIEELLVASAQSPVGHRADLLLQAALCRVTQQRADDNKSVIVVEAHLETHSEQTTWLMETDRHEHDEAASPVASV